MLNRASPFLPPMQFFVRQAAQASLENFTTLADQARHNVGAAADTTVVFAIGNGLRLVHLAASRRPSRRLRRWLRPLRARKG